MADRYTQDELEQAFEAVSPADWRDPIDVTLSDEALAAAGGYSRIYDAIVHFTATAPTLEVGIHGNRIQAAGYRAGPERISTPIPPAAGQALSDWPGDQRGWQGITTMAPATGRAERPS